MEMTLIITCRHMKKNMKAGPIVRTIRHYEYTTDVIVYSTIFWSIPSHIST